MLTHHPASNVKQPKNVPGTTWVRQSIWLSWLCRTWSWRLYDSSVCQAYNVPSQIGSSFRILVGLLLLCIAQLTLASSSEDAKGLWITAEKDGVLEFKPCPGAPATLCGHVVWDKDAGTARDTCGVQIAQLARYDGEAWRDGWVYDPRDGKKYKGALRVKSGELYIRAFVGTEILGQTERLQRVVSLPDTPVCKQ